MIRKWGSVARYGGVLLVGVVLGAGVGAWLASTILLDSSSTLLAIHADDEAYVSYRYAAYPVARARILDHIQYIEAYARQHNGKSPMGLQAAGELVFWYGRLAVAAERSGNATDSGAFTREALESVREGGGVPSASEVRDAVLTLDADWDAKLQGRQ